MPRRKKIEDLQETHVALVLDESSSMASYRKATLDAFNEYLQDRRTKAKEAPTKIWFTKFHSTVSFIRSGVAAEHVNDVLYSEYNPQQMTALHDAIGRTILEVEANLPKDRKTNVIMVIFTDGVENQSREFNGEQIKRMISEREKAGGWIFMYVGANQNAIQTASQLGVRAGNSVNYRTSHSKGAVAAVSRATDGLIMCAATTGIKGDVIAFGNAVNAEDILDTPIKK